MYSVKLICDGNFAKASAVDKSVESVLKMFTKHFCRKARPLNEESDLELHYEYDKLSHDELRIMKKLVAANRALIHLKVIETGGGDPLSSRNSFSSGTSETSGTTCEEKPTSRCKRSRKLDNCDALETEPPLSGGTSGTGGTTTPCGSETLPGEKNKNAALIREAKEICKRLQHVLDAVETS